MKNEKFNLIKETKKIKKTFDKRKVGGILILTMILFPLILLGLTFLTIFILSLGGGLG